eukprot:TRINITY_DN899_c0_g1_i2.p1 TRINITY_DN899_c0_g1~~TRINITY_DN899_c0_g1_i2.p1  ORF type:complete len:112 (-),score=0.87 TRINITY_DN899_c0_g1_i2:379-714(-)
MKSRSQIFSLTIQIQLKMSWNDYVNNLVATGHIEKAALVGSFVSCLRASVGAALLSYEFPVTKLCRALSQTLFHIHTCLNLIKFLRFCRCERYVSETFLPSNFSGDLSTCG